MFTFIENFLSYDDNYKPYGIDIQTSTRHTHNHGLKTPDGYSIACGGNKYFLRIPNTNKCRETVSYKFISLGDTAGLSLFVGMNETSRCGYEVRIEWYKEPCSVDISLVEYIDERENLVEKKTFNGTSFPKEMEVYNAYLDLSENLIQISLGENIETSFSVKVEKARIGFSRPDYIGEVFFTKIEVITEDVVNDVIAPVKVEIPTINGGTMPFTMEYRIFDCVDKRYVTATLDGGPQYRENFPDYPLNTDQYCTEFNTLTRPYFTVNGEKFRLSDDKIVTTESYIHWKEILTKYLHIITLPFSITVSIEKEDIKTLGFGYENDVVSGFHMQSGASEFVFSVTGEYLGEKQLPDTFRLISSSEKQAVKCIPESVYEYQTVKKHFAENHYFAENEDIVFRIESFTDRDYISFKVELQDVFGDKIHELKVVDNEIKVEKLSIGVYRVFLTVLQGDAVLKTVDTVFEVYDVTGKKCAPLESGLPQLFSTPNEQKYLDRDAFDPWNNGKACNQEHFYSISSFVGYIGERKRIWEVIKKFGRKWYVWLSKDRTMIEADYRNHLDIVKNADYMLYPSDYGWGSLRSDPVMVRMWKVMDRLREEVLNDFLDERPGAREIVGYERGAEVTKENVIKLYTVYKDEWFSRVQKTVMENVEKYNEIFKEINPDLKRASYGPFPVYSSCLRSSKQCEMSGFEIDDRLSDVLFNGFAQFEDYPSSCSYNTYRSAFGAGTTLTFAPKLNLYPEQYMPSKGGCLDGAVYFANPPIGAVEIPLWFNTTHAREFAFNTPHKTEDGYKYWTSYGFMHRDFSYEYDDAFIRDWKYILKYKPKSSLKGTCYICDFPKDDDRIETEYCSIYEHICYYNISEEGVGYAYETQRISGLPHGFFARWDTLKYITENDVDCLIIPSTKNLSNDVLEKIRELYDKGVSLFATSRVDGLEDLFGVKYAPQKTKIRELVFNGKSESVYPYEDKALYVPDGANVVLTASGMPAIMQYNRTAILNIPCFSMGRAYFKSYHDMARETISVLLRKAVKQVMSSLTSPVMKSDNCAITLFNDTNGNTVLFATDYSNYDKNKMDTYSESYIKINGDEYVDAVSVDNKKVRNLKNKDGVLEGIIVELRQHESTLIKLKRKNQ